MDAPDPSKLSAPAASQRRILRAVLTLPTWHHEPRCLARSHQDFIVLIFHSVEPPTKTPTFAEICGQTSDVDTPSCTATAAIGAADNTLGIQPTDSRSEWIPPATMSGHITKSASRPSMDSARSNRGKSNAFPDLNAVQAPLSSAYRNPSERSTPAADTISLHPHSRSVWRVDLVPVLLAYAVIGQLGGRKTSASMRLWTMQREPEASRLPSEASMNACLSARKPYASGASAHPRKRPARQFRTTGISG